MKGREPQTQRRGHPPGCFVLAPGSWELRGGFQQGSGEVGLDPCSPPWQLSWGAGSGRGFCSLL